MRAQVMRARLSRIVAITLVTLASLASAAYAASRERVLHVFKGKPGKYPTSSLVFDAAGNLYGTTSEGGTQTCSDYGLPGCGIVFKLTPTSKGWKYSILYRFKGRADGAYPNGSLILDAAGNLYGTTAYGGSSTGFAGSGTVFELT